jgi:methylglutaconyl-CoA hydratase
MSDVLLQALEGGVATLTLNRPDKRNALNAELVEALTQALAETSADDRVRVVVLRGAGKDFCAGADLAELERVAEMGYDDSVADASRLGAVFSAMRSHRCPIVAVVQGRALAGGCGLASACDLVLADEASEFGYPEVYLGFVPAMVMAILRRKVGEGQAFDLVATGDRISATRAQELGLVQRVFASADVEAQVGAYVNALAAKPASALRLSKSLLYELDALDFDAGIARGAEVNAEARATPECRAGVRAFLERTRQAQAGQEG